MLEYFQYPLLFAVGILAGILNIMAGGGSTISLPVLIFLGLDSTLANGTNRVAIFIQCLVGTAGFRKQKVDNFPRSIRLAAFTLPGAALGAWFSLQISDVWFQRILALVIVGVVVSMFVPMPKREEVLEVGFQRKWWGYLAMFGIGFYGGFIQVGVGFLLMAVLYHVLRLNLVDVTVNKVAVVLLYTIPALGIFIYNDQVDWVLGLSLAAGTATGGWIGSHLTVKGGDKIIRYALVVALGIMSLKLLEVI